jgi:hypothetical protein
MRFDSYNSATYRRSRFESFFSFLAAAFPGFAFALLSFFNFFFSPCVILVLLTNVFFSACLGGMVLLGCVYENENVDFMLVVLREARECHQCMRGLTTSERRALSPPAWFVRWGGWTMCVCETRSNHTKKQMGPPQSKSRSSYVESTVHYSPHVLFACPHGFYCTTLKGLLLSFQLPTHPSVNFFPSPSRDYSLRD